nr:DNA/RNA non-specific endonuclease [uncultured Marinifilum sp.]
MIQGSAVRKNKFKEDPAVKTGSAKLIDYKGSGYDRGHLCPAAAMKNSNLAMSESFYMSNMSPQAPAFNRGKWKSLESKVRKLTIENDSLYVFLDLFSRIIKERLVPIM